MEKKVLVVCVVVGFLGLVAASLGFAAESKRIKVTFLTLFWFLVFNCLRLVQIFAQLQRGSLITCQYVTMCSFVLIVMIVMPAPFC